MKPIKCQRKFKFKKKKTHAFKNFSGLLSHFRLCLVLFHLTPSHRTLSLWIDGAIRTNADLEAHNCFPSHADLKHLENIFFSREATQDFTPQSTHKAEHFVQVPESQENPHSKADMTILCTSHSAGHKTRTPTAGEHCSVAHIRLSRVEGGYSALKFPTTKAIQSDLQQPTNSILPSTILILPPVIWASHPTEKAGPTGESFISIQVDRWGWGFLHPQNQSGEGLSTSLCASKPPALT